MNENNRQTLLQRMSLPFEAKLAMTIKRIRDWYDYWDGDVFVGFSGGKDSTVLLHIVRSIYKDVPGVFSNTGLEMPEIRHFVDKQENVIRVVPEKTFNRVIKEDGFALGSKQIAKGIRVLKEGPENGRENMYRLFDTGINQKGELRPKWRIGQKWRKVVDSDIKVSEKCCDFLKKNPFKKYIKETGRRPFTGMMISEGGLRSQTITQCNAYDSADPKSSPMLFWTDDDVWEYIERFDVEICEVYYDRIVDNKGNTIVTSRDKFLFEDLKHRLIEEKKYEDLVIYTNGNVLVPAEKRTGCMFCMFGVDREKGANRFQRMYYTHPRHWDLCINKLGLKTPLDLIDVKYIPEDDDSE